MLPELESVSVVRSRDPLSMRNRPPPDRHSAGLLIESRIIVTGIEVVDEEEKEAEQINFKSN